MFRGSVGGALWRPNEPVGMTVLSDRAFDAMNELGWSDTSGAGSAPPGSIAIASDATAPKSPSNILRATFPIGFTSGGDGPGSSDKGISPTKRTIYVCYYVKLSSNFYGHDSGVNKQFYCYDSGDNPWFYFTASGTANNALVPTIAFQSISSAGDFDLGPNLVPGAVLRRNFWELIEVVATGNTAGNADGDIDVYLNGVHVSSKAGMPGGNPLKYTAAGDCLWNRFHYTTIWGGVGGPTVPATMTMDWDHCYLSVK